MEEQNEIDLSFEALVASHLNFDKLSLSGVDISYER